MVLVLIIIILLLEGVVVGRCPNLFVDVEHLGLAVVTDQTDIRGDDMAFFKNNLAGGCQPSLPTTTSPVVYGGDTYDVTRNQLARKNLLLVAIADNPGSHCNVTLQAGNDVGGLFLLVPTDNGVKHQDTDNDSQVDV